MTRVALMMVLVLVAGCNREAPPAAEAPATAARTEVVLSPEAQKEGDIETQPVKTSDEPDVLRLIALKLQKAGFEVLTARDGERLAGFAIMQFGDERAHLSLLAVRPDHQRRGLGKAVATYALRRLKDEGAREAMVFSTVGNDASDALYRSVGFEPIATHRHYRAPAIQSAR